MFERGFRTLMFHEKHQQLVVLDKLVDEYDKPQLLLACMPALHLGETLAKAVGNFKMNFNFSSSACQCSSIKRHQRRQSGSLRKLQHLTACMPALLQKETLAKAIGKFVGLVGLKLRRLHHQGNKSECLQRACWKYARVR